METVIRSNLSELTGRFNESAHIQLMIESGDLKSVDEILSTVRSRSESISQTLDSKPKGQILSIQESLNRGYGEN